MLLTLKIFNIQQFDPFTTIGDYSHPPQKDNFTQWVTSHPPQKIMLRIELNHERCCGV